MESSEPMEDRALAFEPAEYTNEQVLRCPVVRWRSGRWLPSASMPEQLGDFETMRVVLAECRRRGLAFAEAWEIALDALPPATGAATVGPRAFVLGALSATRDAWAAAFERRPYFIIRVDPRTREPIAVDALARASLDALHDDPPGAQPMVQRAGRATVNRETVLVA